MQNSNILKTLLLISGLIAAAVGAALLFTPVAFYASSGIPLGDNISLLNEIRAGGGALLVVGIFITVGAFIKKLTFTATVMTVLMYLAYGLSRLLSMSIDGMPADTLVQATVLELIIGAMSVVALVRYRGSE